eukprot:3749829-Rhodomonas_salina.6
MSRAQRSRNKGIRHSSSVHSHSVVTVCCSLCTRLWHTVTPRTTAQRHMHTGATFPFSYHEFQCSHAYVSLPLSIAKLSTRKHQSTSISC